MRLLVDENLSFRVAERLGDVGHDAVHVTDVDLNDTDDDVIFPWARAEGRVVVTSDADFGTMLALSGATDPSVVLLRSSDHLTPSGQAELLIRVLAQLHEELAAGAIVSASPGRLRIRELPISQTS